MEALGTTQNHSEPLGTTQAAAAAAEAAAEAEAARVAQEREEREAAAAAAKAEEAAAQAAREAEAVEDQALYVGKTYRCMVTKLPVRASLCAIRGALRLAYSIQHTRTFRGFTTLGTGGFLGLGFHTFRGFVRKAKHTHFLAVLAETQRSECSDLQRSVKRSDDVM